MLSSLGLAEVLDGPLVVVAHHFRCILKVERVVGQGVTISTMYLVVLAVTSSKVVVVVDGFWTWVI